MPAYRRTLLPTSALTCAIALGCWESTDGPQRDPSTASGIAPERKLSELSSTEREWFCDWLSDAEPHVRVRAEQLCVVQAVASTEDDVSCANVRNRCYEEGLGEQLYGEWVQNVNGCYDELGLTGACQASIADIEDCLGAIVTFWQMASCHNASSDLPLPDDCAAAKESCPALIEAYTLSSEMSPSEGDDFICSDESLLPASYVCDGVEDCLEGEDESALSCRSRR